MCKCTLSGLLGWCPFLLNFLKIENKVSVIGYKQINKLTQDDISGFLEGNIIAIADKRNPPKYAPESPKKIKPRGKFTTRNPIKILIDSIEILKIKKSSIKKPINAKAENIIINDPLAKPWKPSIMLIECTTPAIAKQVNNSDIKYIERK